MNTVVSSMAVGQSKIVTWQPEMKIAECRVQSAECRVQSAECRVQIVECVMQNADIRVKSV